MTVPGTGGLLQPDPWPLARIRMTTPRLEFRLPNEDELVQLAAVAGEGVHEPGAQPFGIPWGTQPPLLRARSVLQWHWATRGTWSAQRWTLDFAVFLNGGLIGAQGLSAVGFPVRREVATGSWLGLRYQRRGFGKEMRAAVLTLAFGHLGALSAVTGAYQDNAAAIRISQVLGYHDDGAEVADRNGTRVLAHRFRLAATAGTRGWPTVTIEGADDEVLRMCGPKTLRGTRRCPLAAIRTPEQPVECTMRRECSAPAGNTAKIFYPERTLVPRPPNHVLCSMAVFSSKLSVQR